MADFKSSKLGNCKIYLGMTRGDLGTFFPSKLKKPNSLIWDEANKQGLYLQVIWMRKISEACIVSFSVTQI